MRSNDTSDREDRLAEERLLHKTQIAVQEELERQGLRYRDLADRLGVSEARISQLMGHDALNLTIRTVAKIFHRLGEEAVIMTRRDYDAATKSFEHDLEAVWEFNTLSAMNLNVRDAHEIFIEESLETSDEQETAEAEAAAMRRWVA